MTRISILATALLLAMPACAQSQTRVWVSGVPYLCNTREATFPGTFDNRCRKDWRHLRQMRAARQPEVRSWRQEDYHRQDCRPTISVVGTEHASEENAKAAAERAWRDQTRYLHGERFMALEKAHRLKTVCTRSSTGDSTVAKVIDKMTDGGGFLTRCQIEASPCSVIPEEVGK